MESNIRKQKELEELKNFIFASAGFYQILKSGTTLESEFNCIKSIQTIIDPKLYESQLYELAYAYVKLNEGKDLDKELPEEIKSKILEMKIR